MSPCSKSTPAACRPCASAIRHRLRSAVGAGHRFALWFQNSVTVGIISAKGRVLPGADYIPFLQTDVPVNPGNSGGPLFNLKGEVIGINTWIASPSGGSVGLGFSIPINNVKGAIDDFISEGQVKYGWLGVSLIDADKDIAAELGIENRNGALASQIFIGSPADKGGILPGDYIIKLNGRDVRNRDQLVLAVGDLKAGEQATFVVIRNGAEKTITVRIDERKENVVADNSKLWPGVIVTPINDEIRDALKLDAKMRGLYVVEVIAKSPAAVMGLRRGDIIVGINGESARTLSDFYRLLNDKTKRDIWFEVQRDDTTLETMRYKRP